MLIFFLHLQKLLLGKIFKVFYKEIYLIFNAKELYLLITITFRNIQHLCTYTFICLT